MNTYLEAYRVSLKTKGPVFVGSGREFSKKEYLFLKNHRIGIVDINRLYQVVKSHKREQDFEKYMLSDARMNLGKWLETQRIGEKEVLPCLKYTLDSGDTVLQRGTGVTIMECVKDAYGCPYIPGSSIKGMLRTVLLAGELLQSQEACRDAVRLLGPASQEKKNRNIYLLREAKQIEARAFRTLNRDPKHPTDAVNDVMSGFVVSDSGALDKKDIVLCQRLERHVDATEKRLNILRECVRPDTDITFTLTVDREICGITADQLMEAVQAFDECYNDCFISSFRGIDRLSGDLVYLGGGSGFVSKTVVYPAFGKERGIAFAQRVFENTRVPREHKHYRDGELGASPHILKCTSYEGRTLQMGLCRLEKLERLN